MFEGEKHEYACLEGTADSISGGHDSISEDENSPFLQRRNWRHLNSERACFLVVLLASILFNFFMLYRSNVHQTVFDDGLSPYAHLPYDNQQTFHYFNDYWGENRTLEDELWNAIDTDPIMVVIDDEYKSQHNLPPSIPFPWDETKSIYYVRTYHLLHCLKQLHKAITDFELTGTTSVKLHHIRHCLDAFRQKVMCDADDGLMPSLQADGSVGDGQNWQCRSMDKLRSWVMHGERNACFKMVDEYRPEKHTLEKFGFCEETSPYYSRMTEYFQENGHQPMFTDELGE